ncbi:MAG TPA: hypothetical protein ENH55_09830 [Aurantimonas coralicida]|nr:hypothetical protein [Aurantimonas coralicida]
MSKISSAFYQARADDAAEEIEQTKLAGAKGRFEQSRIAWQGLADTARRLEEEAAVSTRLTPEVARENWTAC